MPLTTEEVIEFNVKKGVILTIVYGIVLIAVPSAIIYGVLTSLFDLGSYIENADLIILNGIIITFVLGFKGFMKEKTLMRFVMDVVTIIIIIVMLFIGYNVYTLFLPVSGFAVITLTFSTFFYIKLSLMGTAIMLIVVKVLFTTKSFLEFYEVAYT